MQDYLQNRMLSQHCTDLLIPKSPFLLFFLCFSQKAQKAASMYAIFLEMQIFLLNSLLEVVILDGWYTVVL